LDLTNPILKPRRLKSYPLGWEAFDLAFVVGFCFVKVNYLAFGETSLASSYALDALTSPDEVVLVLPDNALTL